MNEYGVNTRCKKMYTKLGDDAASCKALFWLLSETSLACYDSLPTCNIPLTVFRISELEWRKCIFYNTTSGIELSFTSSNKRKSFVISCEDIAELSLWFTYKETNNRLLDAHQKQLQNNESFCTDVYGETMFSLSLVQRFLILESFVLQNEVLQDYLFTRDLISFDELPNEIKQSETPLDGFYHRAESVHKLTLALEKETEKLSLEGTLTIGQAAELVLAKELLDQSLASAQQICTKLDRFLMLESMNVISPKYPSPRSSAQSSYSDLNFPRSELIYHNIESDEESSSSSDFFDIDNNQEKQIVTSQDLSDKLKISLSLEQVAINP